MLFTPEQMHRPLFEELTTAIQRQNSWEGPHGFLFGGMANLTLQELGQQYFNAANELVELIKHKEVEDHTLGNPVIYLYRHSIELFIKAALPDGGRGTRHDLSRLADKFEQLVRQEFGAQIPDWIISRIKELACLDPDSTTFRYNQNLHLLRTGEFHVDLLYLQQVMKVLNIALVGVIAGIACGEGGGVRRVFSCT